MREEVEVRPNGSKRVKMFCDDPSLTRQEFKDDCDLAKIVKRFAATPEGRDALARAQGFVDSRFEDVSNVPDYQTSLEYIKRADEAFMQLPGEVRRRFNHNPAEFLNFVDNPKNLDELRSMGLAKPKAVDDTNGQRSVSDPK